MSKESFKHRLIDGLTMFLVTALSLLLLLYVAFGEGKRTYELIHIEKVTAQGRLAQLSIEKFLREGLPLKQYAGFATLAQPIADSEDVDAMAVYDNSGRQLFLVTDKKKTLTLPEPPDAIKNAKENIEIDYGDAYYKVILPLRTRFETAGTVVVYSPTDLVTERLRPSFVPLLYVAAGLSAVFAILILIAAPYLPRSRVPWLQIGYGATFLIMAGFVIWTLVTLYYDGVQGKTNATAVTLSQRLNDIVEFNLSFKDLDGLERTFGEYRRLNSEVSEAALIVDNAREITTDPAKAGKGWNSDPWNYEHRIDMSRPDQSRRIDLAVTVPRDVVFQRVVRSIKNFAALFIASAFLSGLFLQVAASMQSLRASNVSSQNAAPNTAGGDAALVFVKPVFFLAVFLDSLTYAFLPKFMQEAATASGVSVGFASAPFTAYYLLFALSLIPAGNIADRYGPRPLIVVGLILAGASVLGLALPLGIMEMAALRAVSGVGQGLLLIGVQTYILAVASPEKKTQGAAIIVFGFQGGMISGMALGSLLVNLLHPQGVFAVSAAVAVATTIYTLLLLPRIAERKEGKGGLSAAVNRLVTDLKKVIASGEFLKTLVCIGIPAKAILTGTITFALPLLLHQQDYRPEDIGQVVMLYGLGVVATTGYVSRLVDRTRNTQSILFWGAIMSGLGLVLIGLTGSAVLDQGMLTTNLVVAGVIIVGVAHGFINAPVVTHVAHSQLAARVGAVPATTAYRFLERIGHIAGPFLLSQLFLIWGQNMEVVGGIGIATAALGLIFVAHLFSRRIAPAQADIAR